MARLATTETQISNENAQKRPSRRILGPSVAAAICLAILVSLGVWQIRRLAWKEELLSQIAARLHAPAQPLPPEASWASLTPEDYEYRHVVAHGVYENDDEVQVFDPGGDSGPGYRVLTPLKLDDGSIVIIDRGFVEADRRLPSTRIDSIISAPTGVTGAMRSPQSRNLFTPADDPSKGVWFTRDPAEIASAFHLSRVAPFTIDADPTPSAAKDGPRASTTALDIPNNHLSYAVTWFGLAATLAGVYGVFILRRLRE